LINYPAPIRIGVFALGLAGIWLVAFLSLTAVWGTAGFIAPVSMVLLYAGFVVMARVWGRVLYGQPRPLKFYGWAFGRKGLPELLTGLATGLGMLLLLFVVQSSLGWVQWLAPSAKLGQIIGEGLLLGLAVGCAEELLFRGWLLQELEQDYTPRQALLLNSLIFAALHFLKPLPEILKTWPQGLGLVILGVLLVWARRQCHGRLGLAIGLHGGLVWGYYILRVGELIRYPRTVPTWVTGINDNPLAGVIGLGFITLLAGMLGWRWRRLEQGAPSSEKPV
jgi:uncharacterized protein